MTGNGSGIDRSPRFLSGGGEMGALMRAHDWLRTPLGAPETWPQSLRSAVSICLGSSFPICIYWGQELALIYNDAWSPIPGNKHPEALGRPAREVWPEIWDTIGPMFERVVASGTATRSKDQLLAMRRHGYTEECYFDYTFSPIRDEAGRVGGVFNAVVETTYRVIAERRTRLLRELGERTGTARSAEEACAIAAATLAAAPADMPFCLLYMLDDKKAGHALLVGAAGLLADEPAAPASVDLADPAAPWPFSRLVATGQTEQVDGLSSRFATRLTGGLWPEPTESALIAPIAAARAGSTVGFLVAGVSPRRALDEEYRAFIEGLAAQVSRAVANARAYDEERKRAEALAEIDRAKTIFFSNASHEFRTPLSLMLGPLEDMLVRHPTAATLVAERRDLELMHRNGLRLLKLVNTLLDFSRIEAGRIEAVYEPVDLAAYTADLASTFRSAMSRAGLSFIIDCPPLPAPAYVDRDMWEKIVLNLVSNAFKYTLEGEVAVALRPAGQEVELVVRDTGIGIPEAELPRLFERFHRVEGQRGRTTEGTGIGLALVQELVKLHGGTVEVQSVLGRGTTFRVTIPLGTAHLPTERIGAARTSLPTEVRAEAFVEEALRWLPGGEPTEAAIEKELIGPAPAGSVVERARVLVADDNADMLQYVRRLLATRYEVEAVPDGQAALDAARARRPDLILTDVMMPRLDGFGLLQAVRADGALRDLPVVLLSARAGEEAKVEGLQAGADDYLLKPFSARELIARVDANLQLARGRRDAAEELRRLNETLEQRVAAAIAERAKVEEALRQAQKMEAIGQLTGGVAHDFNNLLQVILGNVDAVRRRLHNGEVPTPGELARQLDRTAHGAERAARLTQQLLAFGRRQPLAPLPIDVNKLVGAMSEMLHRTLGETIKIETVQAAGLWTVFADPNQLESALLNLAVNARDAMPDGGKLTIETGNAYIDEDYAAFHHEVEAGQYVLIAVSDTGTGMTKDVSARAFDPFFTTKDVGQGTGLGLSQVYGFVKQSGGHAKIYSEPGEGTTIRLYLPRHVVAGVVADERLEKQVPTGKRGDLILIVEDEEDVRTGTSDMLRELGYGVVDAPDGPTALAILKSNPDIRLLLTDVGLPGGLNGRQLADEALRRRPGLKLLFTTGYARNAIVHQGRLDPGIELLSKPFTYAQLGAKVRETLDR